MLTVQSLYRYPIKGFSGERLAQVALTPHHTIAGDRRYGVRHAESAFDSANPTWHKKREFLQLAHTADLVRVHTALNPDTGVMTIEANGTTLFVGNVASEAGRRGVDTVLNALLKDSRGPVQLVDAGAISLTDVEPPYLSIINLATVRHIAAKANAALDPIRFRGNINIESDRPWAEFDWVGKTITLGGATLKVIKRIQRCVATSVNPITASRDVEVPALLQKAYGHMDCGVYVDVVSSGVVRDGDTLAVS